jgi:hypothetical protein
VTHHLDAEVLARYQMGDVPWWRAPLIRAHLTRCAACRELDAELAEVPSLLASTSAPPIPQYLAARIQGALAHQAALRTATAQATTAQAAPAATAQVTTAQAAPAATAEPVTSEAPATPGRPDLPVRQQRRPRRLWLPQLPALGSPAAVGALAAALALIAAGGVEIALHTGHPSTSSPSTSAGHRGVPAAGPALRVPGASYGPALQYSRDGQHYRVTPMMTNTDFTSGQLASQVSAMEGRSPSAVAPAPAVASPQAQATPPISPRASFGDFTVTGLDGCVNRIAGGNLLVVLVDVALFRAAPATIIVTEASAAGPEQIWVVGTACSATTSDLLAHAQLAGRG